MIITRTKRTDFTERTQNLRGSMNVWPQNKRKELRPYEVVLASINCWSLSIAKSLSDVENEPTSIPLTGSTSGVSESFRKGEFIQNHQFDLLYNLIIAPGGSMNVWPQNKRKELRPYEVVLASINCWSLSIAKSLSDVENEPTSIPLTGSTSGVRGSMNVWPQNKRKELRPYEVVLASINCWSLSIAKSLSDVENEPTSIPLTGSTSGEINETEIQSGKVNENEENKENKQVNENKINEERDVNQDKHKVTTNDNSNKKKSQKKFQSPEKPMPTKRKHGSHLAASTSVLNEAINLMRSIQSNKAEKDEYSFFGEQVAIKLRKIHSPQARFTVRNIINQALFDGEWVCTRTIPYNTLTSEIHTRMQRISHITHTTTIY
ncbi:hypothetical protein FQR65_LT17081 [Abscondita terminalis]|nr:hypothetical protein FQR65_LT17081 [Abscondita terminalis]